MEILPFLGGGESFFLVVRYQLMAGRDGGVLLAVPMEGLGDVEGRQHREDVGLDADDQELEDDERRRDDGGHYSERGVEHADVVDQEVLGEQEEDRQQDV